MLLLTLLLLLTSGQIFASEFFRNLLLTESVLEISKTRS